jgi:hypothetical protein
VIKRREGNPPFVIDRALPGGVFERAPGAFELMAETHPDKPEGPKEFATHDEAEGYLRAQVTAQVLEWYDFTILPKEVAWK